MSTLSDEFWLAEAVRRFVHEYATVVGNRRVQLLVPPNALLKFGRNPDMGAGAVATVWDLGIANETYVSTNIIDVMSSSSASDTTSVVIEGHYLSAPNVFRTCVLRLVLTGQTPADLANAVVIKDDFGGFFTDGKLARVNRLTDDNGVDLVGDVYVYQSGQTVTLGVPQDLTLTHAKMRGTAGLNRSNKCATTISNDEFLILTAARSGVARTNAAFVDYSLEIRTAEGVFTEILPAVASRDSGFSPIFNAPPYIIVPPNADIRMRGTSSANNTGGVASFNGLVGSLTAQ
jgi:hypothetical protein